MMMRLFAKRAAPSVIRQFDLYRSFTRVTAGYLLILIIGSSPIAGAATVADPWIGTYQHVHLIGTIAGVSARITYTLTVHAGTGTKGATLSAVGYQTFDEVLCDTKADRDQLQIHFRSYPDGGTSNQSGVELYQPGALLLTLAWRDGQLITLWGEYNDEAANREREGAQFKKLSPPRAK